MQSGKKEPALILKNHATTGKSITILTLSLGKIQAILRHDAHLMRARPGTLIACNLLPIRSSHNYFVQDLTIIAVPHFTHHPDIIWLHHLLELCYHLLPHLFPHEELFGYLQHYFFMMQKNHFSPKQKTILQKACILHMLSLLGAQHEEPVGTSLWDNVLLIVENMEHEYYTSESPLLEACHEEQLTAWILASLQVLPCYKILKTVSFMYPTIERQPCT